MVRACHSFSFFFIFFIFIFCFAISSPAAVSFLMQQNTHNQLTSLLLSVDTVYFQRNDRSSRLSQQKMNCVLKLYQVVYSHQKFNTRWISFSNSLFSIDQIRLGMKERRRTRKKSPLCGFIFFFFPHTRRLSEAKCKDFSSNSARRKLVGLNVWFVSL